MPRRARIVLPEVALHVVQRGHDRDPCFFAPADYLTYLRYLRHYALRHGCRVHAYCLMTNHVHLLLTPSSARACALLMKELGQCYVQTVNKARGRTGTLWEGRFQSRVVPTESYALACYRYIELNPVSAGMVHAPRDYRWSSYRANALGRDEGLVAPHPAFEALAPEGARRASAYRALFDEPIAPAVLKAIEIEPGRPGRRPRTRVKGSVPITLAL